MASLELLQGFTGKNEQTLTFSRMQNEEHVKVEEISYFRQKLFPQNIFFELKT